MPGDRAAIGARGRNRVIPTGAANAARVKGGPAEGRPRPFVHVQFCAANYCGCCCTLGGTTLAGGNASGHAVPHCAVCGACGFGYTSCALYIGEEGPNPPGG